jgi:hypothetical protein
MHLVDERIRASNCKQEASKASIADHFEVSTASWPQSPCFASDEEMMET